MHRPMMAIHFLYRPRFPPTPEIKIHNFVHIRTLRVRKLGYSQVATLQRAYIGFGA